MAAKLSAGSSNRTKQPDRPAAIDWSNPLSRGLQILFDGARCRDLVSNRPFTPRIPKACPAGLSHAVTAQASVAQLPNARFVAGSGITVFVLIDHDTLSTNAYQWFTGLGTYAGTGYFSFGPQSGTDIKVASTGDSFSSPTGNPSTAGTRTYSIAHAGTTLRGYVNGAQSGSVTYSFSMPTGPQWVQIGAGQSDYTDEFLAGRYLLVAYWNRELSASENRELHLNPWQLFAAERTLFFAPAGGQPQLLVPIADFSAGGWTPSTGSDLYAMLDESTASDTDYIVSTTATSCELRVASGTDPAVSTGHVLRYRLLSGTGSIAVALKQGSTTIASFGPHTLTGSAQDFAQTLTGTQADNISDYSDLRVVFTAE